MKRVVAMLLPGLVFIGGTLGSLRGGEGDWHGLLGNSPFGQKTAAPLVGVTGDLEFRGLVQEESVLLVNLYNPATKTSQWVPLLGRAPGLEVQAYDAATGRLRITQDGRVLTLSLKEARVALVSNTASLQLTDQPAPETADLPEFIRNLPPEARQMLQEVRRRRALRPPFPGTEDDPPAEPAAPANR